MIKLTADHIDIQQTDTAPTAYLEGAYTRIRAGTDGLMRYQPYGSEERLFVGGRESKFAIYTENGSRIGSRFGVQMVTYVENTGTEGVDRTIVLIPHTSTDFLFTDVRLTTVGQHAFANAHITNIISDATGNLSDGSYFEMRYEQTTAFCGVNESAEPVVFVGASTGLSVTGYRNYPDAYPHAYPTNTPHKLQIAFREVASAPTYYEIVLTVNKASVRAYVNITLYTNITVPELP